jgi:hypothetical protein
VRRGHPARPLPLLLAGALLAPTASPRPARAQAPRLSATLDAGAAVVHYDGFLASGAASMTPALQLDAPLATFTARGTYLVFQSGNQSVQGLVAGSAFTPAAGPGGLLRGEMSGTIGMSAYERADEGMTRYGHALGRVRLHLMTADRGAYAGGSVGRTSLGDAPRAVAAYGVGAWRRVGSVAAELSATATRVGDTAFVDGELATRWARGRWDIDAAAGLRTLSEGGGRGVFGEAIATYWLSSQVALVASGGRYPTDPRVGSVAGRYGAVAIRIARRLSPAPVGGLAYMRPYRLARGRAEGAGVRRAGVEVLPPADPSRAGARGLRIRMPGASLVEVMGDFTDWQQVPLTRVGDDLWELAVPLAPGAYRFNVRADGGTWVVPPGATAYADDFGGIVAVIVVR